ncbi:MAG TPA: N-acetyl-gamma-glutamyl-phosphate reductase [Kofleriaceae bacterium]|nr:N-acetyl-gamma-glutamyl-phosphate reductase [Kofleriaceae bacterium]
MHNVAVFGAAGYSGLELVKLLANHPGVRIACAASDARAGTPIDDMAGTRTRAAFVTTQAALATPAEVALLATPPEAAAELTPKLLAAGKRVIDLSNAHRADPRAVYGLTSLFGADVGGAALVANPGCYATAVITALAPVVRHGLVERDIAVAAGSGVTGAGRTSDEAMSLGEMYGEVRAYKVLRHQHVPEIEAALGRVAPSAEARPRVALTTHLLPIARGIFATVTARLRSAITTEGLAEYYRAEYANDPSVAIAATAEQVSLRRVVGTNLCAVGVASQGTVGGFAVITAALDNLMKGAAGQAVENLNAMLGLDRMSGLSHLARHA